jgi:hypothetical protein
MLVSVLKFQLAGRCCYGRIAKAGGALGRLCLENSSPLAVMGSQRLEFNLPARAKCSGVQPEKARDKENDDDDADDVENVHGVLR